MPDDDDVRFAGNSSIDAAIKEMLLGFDDRSRKRIRKAILSAGSAAAKHGDENTDAAARHVFRELVPAAELNNAGFRLRYEERLDGKTPDWIDEDSGLVMECYTYERGGSSRFDDRVASAVIEKTGKYSSIVEAKGLQFVVAVYLDFFTCMTVEECAENPQRFRRLFESNEFLSGLLFFTETHVEGSRQRYGFACIAAGSSVLCFPNWPFHTVRLAP